MRAGVDRADGDGITTLALRNEGRRNAPRGGPLPDGNQGYRSDAEQALLFAAHPDPSGSPRSATACPAMAENSTSAA